MNEVQKGRLAKVFKNVTQATELEKSNEAQLLRVNKALKVISKLLESNPATTVAKSILSRPHVEHKYGKPGCP